MRNIIFGIPLLILSSCWLTPERIDFDDSRLKPLFSAMDEVNRDSLGFTKIDSTDDIRIEKESTHYDIMLHVYGNSSRTIAFKKIRNGYKWIGEQEIHYGPREYETPDGTLNESITITFETVPISGHALNTINISYLGPDSYGQDDMPLVQAERMIKTWNE